MRNDNELPLSAASGILTSTQPFGSGAVVSLTPKGRQIRAKVEAARNALIDDVFRDLTPTEGGDLRKLLDKLIAPPRGRMSRSRRNLGDQKASSVFDRIDSDRGQKEGNIGPSPSMLPPYNANVGLP